jgi:cob(I)alamin adenosyltransferase
MKIYTRTGDDGTTGLFGGSRRSKADSRVEAYGTVDEANASIAAARAVGLSTETDTVLEKVENELFTIGAELGCTPGTETKLKMTLIDASASDRLEREIDAAEEGLAPLKSFVLPGGSAAAAALHVARCVVRRAERSVVAAAREAPVRSDVIIYLNRLSDLLFVLARRANHLAGVADVPWRAPKK